MEDAWQELMAHDGQSVPAVGGPAWPGEPPALDSGDSQEPYEGERFLQAGFGRL